MKTMFKKTLVAAALAGFGFSAYAADVTTNVVNVSAQGSVTGDINAGTVLVALEAAYAVGDTVTFNFTGGLKTAPLTLNTVVGAALAEAPANKLTLGRIGQTATSATYRVTQITGSGAVHGFVRFGALTGTGDNAAGNNHPDTSLVFKAADVTAAGKVAVTYSATLGSSSTPLDTPVEYNADPELASGALFNVRNQFVASINAATGRFDGVLDVAQDREQFITPVVGTTDILTIGLVNNTGDTGAVAKTSTSFTVKGDFSWAAAAAVATPACTGGAVVGTPVLTATSYTFVCNAATTGATLELDIDQAADTVSVSPTTFTVDASHVYGTGSILAQTALNGGEWKVNGSNITIPYMVYGTVGTKTFSQVVNLTNNGSQAGTIYADVWATDADGKSVPVLTNVIVGTSNPKATTKLAGELRSKIEAAGFANGTVAIRLLTDVKADTVSVYSAYVDNATSERAIVNNDSPVNVSNVINQF
jgi:hypothetical protein